MMIMCNMTFMTGHTIKCTLIRVLTLRQMTESDTNGKNVVNHCSANFVFYIFHPFRTGHFDMIVSRMLFGFFVTIFLDLILFARPKFITNCRCAKYATNSDLFLSDGPTHSFMSCGLEALHHSPHTFINSNIY